MDGEKPDIETHEPKLQGVRQEVRNLQVKRMRPGQSAEKPVHLADLERSAGGSEMRVPAKVRVETV
jgi:hypothetical protein